MSSGKGMGLAAPQIGQGGTAALIIPPDADADAEPIVLLTRAS
jgi:peptide deformylase